LEGDLYEVVAVVVGARHEEQVQNADCFHLGSSLESAVLSLAFRVPSKAELYRFLEVLKVLAPVVVGTDKELQFGVMAPLPLVVVADAVHQDRCSH